MKTTEFWISVLVVVGTLALVLAGKVSADAWLSVAGVGSAGYAISRGIVKASASKASNGGAL